MVTKITRLEAPTEVDHYQIRRTIDFCRPHGEDLGRIADGISKLIANTKTPSGVGVNVRGSVEGMRALPSRVSVVGHKVTHYPSFAQGLVLSLLLSGLHERTYLNVAEFDAIVLLTLKADYTRSVLGIVRVEDGLAVQDDHEMIALGRDFVAIPLANWI